MGSTVWREDEAVEPARGRVRRERSVIAVTGAATPLARALVERLRDDPTRPTLTEIGKTSPDALTGVTTVVHLATDRQAATPTVQRRATNVHGTEQLLAAAVASGVRRVVLLTSAMVYGAYGTHRVPLDEDAPVAAGARDGLVGDWLAMERVAGEHHGKGAGRLEVVSVRPASLVGLVCDSLLPGLFESVRLLAIRDARCHWQFCHTDDLLAALVAAAVGAVDGPVTVGCDGWMDRRQVESIAKMRSVVLPSAVAFATAERLHRIGVLASPASDLDYLIHPWVVGSQRLRATGWIPSWTNQEALVDHLDALGERVGKSLVVVDRKNATRAAAGAGATLAVVGSLAVARARSRRR
jgi:nucleoside-diphosphate-sugar epimerase